MAHALNPQERLDWLRLIRSENVGPVTFFQLLRHYGSAAASLEALPGLARRGGRSGLKIATRGEAERELAQVTALGGQLVAWGEPDYPPLLAEIEDAPPLVTVLGHPSLLAKPAIGIVGARNASVAGQRFARELAWDLGRRGFVVVSGLARGIDAAAHGGALESGTAAVVAGGADIVYPEQNRGLYDEIVARGAVIAESPVGTEPSARLFPRRNRLISGMSAGIVVVEAALKSGSLITARFAGEQGREVFAVPGSPLDPRCRGTNDLIRQGATLVESAEDVANQLALYRPKPLAEDRRRHFPVEGGFAGPSEAALDRVRAALGEALGPTPVTLDELLRVLAEPLPLVQLVLLELELAGRLTRHPGGRLSLG